MKGARKIGIAVGAAVVAGAVYWAVRPRPLPVDLARATRGPLRVSVEEEGRTRVKDRYVLSAPLSGNLARIEYHAGDAVEAGAVLARIAPVAPPLLDARTRAEAEARVRAGTAAKAQAGAGVERARLALELAEREAERQRTLLSKGGTSQRGLDLALIDAATRRADLASARFGTRMAAHDLEMSQAVLGRLSGRGEAAEAQLEIPSPLRGRVLKVLQQSEGVVAAGTPLVEIGDPTALEIVVDVLTPDAVRIRPGAAATIERWGGDRRLSARVRLVEPSAFTKLSALGVEEQRVAVVLDLLDPPAVWSALGDGFRVEVAITLSESADALRIPSTALFRDGDGWATFRVVGGRTALRRVRVGRENDVHAEITSGLRAGDVVVVSPGEAVTPGVRVESR